jgi:NADPH:quinone reductase-like Zn-dependent oxidoreductase
MEAIVLNKIGNIEELHQNLIIQKLDNLSAGGDEVIIKVHFAALNHRDLWITRGQYANIKLPIILGSDGAGTIEEIGTDVKDFKPGDEVIINPSFNWGDNEDFRSKSFKILGLPDNGTLTEFIKVPLKYVYNKPAHLTLSEASALPLAGLTAFRAVRMKANIKKGEDVLITGIGGGVSTFAMIFSLALGANVYVTSGSEKKIEAAIKLGAKEGFEYKNEKWDEELLNKLSTGIDTAIDGTGGSTISKILNVVKESGRIVSYGATLGAVQNFEIRKLFWKQLTFLGTTMGSDKDFREMLNFVNENKIKPIIDKIFEFKDYINAFERMNNSEQFGKIIIRIK